MAVGAGPPGATRPATWRRLEEYLASHRWRRGGDQRLFASGLVPGCFLIDGRLTLGCRWTRNGSAALGTPLLTRAETSLRLDPGCIERSRQCPAENAPVARRSTNPTRQGRRCPSDWPPVRGQHFLAAADRFRSRSSTHWR